jgi:hypothetical protein
MVINPTTFKMDIANGTPCLVGKDGKKVAYFAGRDQNDNAFFCKDQKTAIDCPYGAGFQNHYYIHYKHFQPIIKKDEVLNLELK